jgi:glycine/D-amino acid oxidase-like deaminating enzyme
LTVDKVRKVEPALARSKVAIAGDSFKFARQLAAFLAARGVTFMYRTPITSIHTEGDHVSGVQTGASHLGADA